ncbi:tetratricopeptide repeat protein, partial [Bacteroides salyersiae]
IYLFETAARLFPEDMTANLNAAAAALSRRDTVYAKQYMDHIKSIPETPEYYNTAGVLEMLSGDYDKAESYLRKAVEMGLPEAGMNLGEITKKRENMALIGQK